MDYVHKMRKKFLQFNKLKGHEGKIIRLGFGDDNLVSELRKGNFRYLVSVYVFRNGTFHRLYQERYKTFNEANIRMKEIQGEF